MAIISNGIMGDTRKSVGNFVTYISGGQNIIRKKASSVNNPNTLAQQKQREAFSMLVSLFRIAAPAIKVSFPERIQKHSAYNAFMEKNTPEAITGPVGNQLIDYPNLTTGKGSQLVPKNTAITSTVTGRVSLTWDDNSNGTTGLANDKAVIILINSIKDEVETSVFEATRASAGLDITVPSGWLSNTVHAYISFISNDNSKASDSVYIGSVAVSE